MTTVTHRGRQQGTRSLGLCLSILPRSKQGAPGKTRAQQGLQLAGLSRGIQCGSHRPGGHAEKANRCRAASCELWTARPVKNAVGVLCQLSVKKCLAVARGPGDRQRWGAAVAAAWHRSSAEPDAGSEEPICSSSAAQPPCIHPATDHAAPRGASQSPTADLKYRTRWQTQSRLSWTAGCPVATGRQPVLPSVLGSRHFPGPGVGVRVSVGAVPSGGGVRVHTYLATK